MGGPKAYGRRRRLDTAAHLALRTLIGLALVAFVFVGRGYAASSAPAMMVPGQLNVSDSGAFTYKIPIAVPPGTGGMAPSLSLDYSSQAGDGTLGWGWMLSGVPAIGRCPRTLAQDGVHGSLNFDDNDRYCMEGQRLVAVSGAYGANGTIYRTENDGFSQIISYGSAGNGPSYFVVQTKAGQTMEFGNTTDSKILAVGKTTVRTWALDKITDSVGNYLTVAYTNDTTHGQAYPIEIDYTGNAGAGLAPYNSVQFAYNTSRLYPVPTYQAGSLQETTVLLTDVRTYQGTGGSGTLVTDYRLAYNPPASGAAHYELTSVTQCNATSGGSCLNPTTFGWQGTRDSPPLSAVPNGIAQGYHVTGGWDTAALHPVDLNGDGINDLVIVVNNGTTCPSNGSTYLGSTTGNFTASAMTIVRSGTNLDIGCLVSNQYDYAIPTGLMLSTLASISGDEFADFVAETNSPCCKGTGNKVEYYFDKNNGSLTFNQLGTVTDNFVQFGDFNGDGKLDYFSTDEGAGGDNMCLGNGDGTFSCGTGPTLYYNSTTSYQYVAADFTGSGCSDIYQPVTAFAYGIIATNCSAAVASINTPDTQNANVILGDFNGDGLMDLLVVPTNGSTNATLYLSTGTGFSTGYTIPNSTDWYKYSIITGDWNGDGKTDIALIASGGTGMYGVGTPHEILLSTGTEFNQLVTIANNNASDTTVTATAGDWNNDGASDIWLQKPSGDTEELFGDVPEAITTVNNGLGIVTTVTYEPLNKNAPLYQKCATAGTYVCGATYPTQSVDGPIYVVSQLSSGNGIGGNYISTYAYQAAQSDLHGRGFLGFGQIAITDPQTGVVQTTTYGQAFPLTGVILSQTKTVSGVTLESTVYTYNPMSLGAGTDGVTRFFVELQKSVVTANDLNGSALPTVTTTYGYDCDTGSACSGASATGYGNATSVTVGASDGSTRTTNNDYENDTSNGHWYLARLMSATQTNVVGSSNVTRQTSFSYDVGASSSTGLLKSEIVEPESSSDPSLRMETDYLYDAFGDKSQATLLGCVWSGSACSTTGRISQTAFDKSTYHGQFPTTATNALGQQETWSYAGNVQFGGPTSHTGPNGLTTTWQYDTFGRKTLEVRPDGNRTAIAYDYCTTTSCPTLPPGLTAAQLPANVEFFTISTPETSAGAQNGPVSVAFYDGLSRLIATDAEGFDASGTGCTAAAPCWIRTATQFDANGRVSQTSRPYFVAGGAAQWTVNAYDALGRVTQARFPDSSTLTTTYCGLTVSTTNANGQIRTVTDNAEGKTAYVYEMATATCNTSGNRTSYVYDAFDNTLTITDPASNTVANNSYDVRGRKIKAIDPDKGTWAYTYDGFGELATQTDAKGQVTIESYDPLGRVIAQTGAFTSQFAYDTAPGKGVGKLASAGSSQSDWGTFNWGAPNVWFAGGLQKTYAYDSLGRPSSVTVNNGGGTFVYGLTYDASSRLSTVSYPSGFTAKYTYTANGYLYQVSDNSAGTVFWTASSRDAELHLLTQTQGNGVTITQAFNAQTGLIQSILAGADNSVSNQTFNFDPLGNLTSRTWLNGSAVVRENACYDGLNRLQYTLITSGTACTGAGAVSVSYDALGNITEKTDVCATANCFIYGGSGAGPHALTSIAGAYNGVTNPTFSYDADGLMTGGAGRTVTATTFDMVASIAEGSNSATFSYDSGHQRYKMVTTGVNAGTTYYLNDSSSGALEEQEVANGTTTWRDYVVAGGQLVALRLCSGAGPCTATPTLQYFVLDHLGSVSVIVSSTGAILNQLNYDAWGKRRNADGSAINCTAGMTTPSSTTRGFTGQEMIDGLCLVNLNARVYDPGVGRFMSADPVVGDETVPQELNRYSYVLDNPLSLTDPSGLCFLGCFWDQSWFRELLGIAVAIALEDPQLIGTAGLNGALGITGLSTAELTVVDGGIIGGVSGIVSTGTLKGAALGVLQGALFAEAGNILGKAPTGSTFSSAVIAYKADEFLAHGLVGGIVSVISGGKFQSGFLAGGISAFTPTPQAGQSLVATFEGTVASAVLGGVGSELGGGKFANGAETGAFAYLLNEFAHPKNPNAPCGSAGANSDLCIPPIGTRAGAWNVDSPLIQDALRIYNDVNIETYVIQWSDNYGVDVSNLQQTFDQIDSNLDKMEETLESSKDPGASAALSALYAAGYFMAGAAYDDGLQNTNTQSFQHFLLDQRNDALKDIWRPGAR